MKKLFYAVLLAAMAILAYYYAPHAPHEIANWYHAAALEAHLAGNSDAAMNFLGQGVAWSPEQPDLYATRSEIYQRMGRHKDAIREQDRIVEICRASPSLSLDRALNGRAYCRALGEIELNEGLEDVQQAIEFEGGESAFYLDTRGYLYYLLGDLDLAERDLVRAKDLAEEMYHIGLIEIEQTTYAGLREKQRTQYDHFLAVIYHHLGLLYQRQDRTELADRYLSRGDELGYDPERGVW